jgi:predicted transcriptional regulator
MIPSPTKKNKIKLSDYNYKRDIENRLLMSHFTAFDVEVLEEILHSNLKISMLELAEFLEADTLDLLPTLEKLSKTGLLAIKGDTIEVDKEMRKYYDFQIRKFDNDFKPGMEFLQGLLQKVPINILPLWYALPKTADNIFESIVDKFLHTPRVYQRYLAELNFEDLIAQGIIDDLFKSPNLKLLATDIRKKYNLSLEKFEEYLLHLEFNFVCCLSYNEMDGYWTEVVIPFYEWKTYLNHLIETEIEPVKGEVSPDNIAPGETDAAPKDILFVEWSLKRIMKKGWVYYEDYLKGIVEPVGNSDPVELVQVGRNWEYKLPKFTGADREIIRSVVYGDLIKRGLIKTGIHEGRKCIMLTNHGKEMFGD